MLHNESVPQCAQSKQLVSGLHGLHACSRAQLPGRTWGRELQLKVFSSSCLTSRAVGRPALWPGHWAETQLARRIPKAGQKLSTTWQCIQHRNYSRRQVGKMTGQQTRWFVAPALIYFSCQRLLTVNLLLRILCDRSLMQLNSFLHQHLRWGRGLWGTLSQSPSCSCKRSLACLKIVHQMCSCRAVIAKNYNCWLQ